MGAVAARGRHRLALAPPLYSAPMRPNPPKIVTVVLALVLMVIGLVLVYAPSTLNDIVRQLPLGADLTRQLLDLMEKKVVAFVALAASPLLLIAGSLLKGL